MKTIGTNTTWGAVRADLNMNFNDVVKPEEYGAIRNVNPNVFENDATEAIQAAVDSGGVVVFEPGYYYITSPILITKPVNIMMADGLLESQDNPELFNYTNSHTRIYTDLNIDAFVIRSGQVNIYGGVIDFRSVTSHSGSAFKYDLNYNIWGGSINSKVTGNKSTLSNEANGTTAVKIDATGQTSGYATMLDVHIICQNVRYGLHVPEKAANQFFNSSNIYIEIDGFKQVAVVEWGNDLSIKSINQSRFTLTESEKDLYAFKAGCFRSEIDFWVFDMATKYSEQLDRYKPAGYILDSGGENMYKGKGVYLLNHMNVDFADGITPEGNAMYGEGVVYGDMTFNIGGETISISEIKQFIDNLN